MYMDCNVHVFALYFQVPVNHQVRISVPVVRDGYLLMPGRDSTPASRLLEELEGESRILLHILCVHVHVCNALLVIHVHPVYCMYCIYMYMYNAHTLCTCILGYPNLTYPDPCMSERCLQQK